jgi:type II secretory pathway component PulF
MAATLLSDSSEIELHQSTRDQWATPLAATIAVAHLLSGMALVGWFYFLVPRFKHDFNDFGVEIPALTILIIRMSDMVVNYWYLLVPVSPVALILDFLVARWIGRQIGLRVAIAYGVSISLLLFAKVAVFQYVLSETKARLLSR